MKSKKIIWLDNILAPFPGSRIDSYPVDASDEVFWAKNYLEFECYIHNHGVPDFVSFAFNIEDTPENHKDADGAWLFYPEDREYTGADCAKFLDDYCGGHCMPLPRYDVHRGSPRERSLIRSIMTRTPEVKDHLTSGRSIEVLSSSKKTIIDSSKSYIKDAISQCREKFDEGQIVYVVYGLRHGVEPGNVLGLFQKFRDAKDFADEYVLYRGGKYDCVVKQNPTGCMLVSDFDHIVYIKRGT